MKLFRFALLAMAMALVLGACNPGDDEGGKFDINLKGDAEVCEGDVCGGDGTGEATVTINSDENKVCYDIKLDEVDAATAAHIHKGAEGESGPVVVDLSYKGGASGGEACVDGVDEGKLEEISEKPADHYLNVHSERYPDGAARGQLES